MRRTRVQGLGLCLGVGALLAPQDGAAASFAVRSVERVVTGPTLVDAFRHPMGLAIDPRHGILAIGDTGNHRLVLFDTSGRSRGAIQFTTTGGVGVGEPRGIAIDQRGRVFVLDGVAASIEVLSASGSRLGRLQPQLPADAAEARPQFVTAGRSGRLYVLYGGDRVGLAIVEPNGATRCIGFDAPGAGLLQAPLAVAVDSSETRIVVLDPQSVRQVKIFAPDGTLLDSFGPHGEGDGTFSLAAFVTWGPGDTIWVLDTIRHSISIHDAAGTYLGRIGGFGHGPGDLNYPAACGFLSSHRFVVLERGGSRFQIFELESTHSGASGLGARLESSDSGSAGVDEWVLGGR